MRNTSLGLFLKTLLALALVELGLMLALEFFHAGAAAGIILDTILLTVLAAPAIYYFLIRELEALRREEIKLLHAATRIISDAPDFPAALERVLREICVTGGWAAGEAYGLSPDGKRLECAAIWTSEPEKLKTFLDASLKMVFLPGEGLPGRVWKSRMPAWIENVTLDKNFPRASTAGEGGLKGAISVPVLVEGKFILALDFFSKREIRKMPGFQTNFLPAIAAQLGSRFQLKLAEDARKLAQERAFQNQKMESLGKVAGTIAHDFNNILTAIKGFTYLALETMPKNSPETKYIQETAAGLDRGMDLTKQILAFSRNQPSELNDLDLNAVITGMKPMLEMIFQHRVRLKLNLAQGLPIIRANKGQMEQILVNFAVNARDAMPKGGEFSITTLPPADGSDRSCPAGYDVDGRAVRLTVSDTGCGIPEEMIDRVFEPFFTTKPEGEGTGLGLATVYSIVKLHKGGIGLKSVPGKGTTFDICLPAADDR